MLENIKGELARRLENSSGQENLQKLYNNEVKIFFEALLAARDIDDIAIQVKLKFIESMFNEHHYLEALEVLEELLANRGMLTEEELVRVLEQKGVALRMGGRYEESERLFKEMLESEFTWAKRKAYINLGITYCYLTKHTGKKVLTEAQQFFLKAQDLLEPGDSEDRFQISFYMATIYFEKGRFGECLKALEIALNQAPTDQQRAMVFNELARVSIAESKLEIAGAYLDQAEHILTRRSHYHELALAWNLHIRGLWNKKKGEYTNAINCLELALNTFVERELFSEAAEVSYELYALNKFLENGDADEYLADYQYYSRMIS